MKRLIIFILAILFGQLAYTQVGVNTVSPQETLDVNGTLRVQNTGTINSSKILGRDSNGTVGTIDVGDNVIITNNVIHSVGSSDYGIIEVPIVSNSPNTFINNLDLQLTTTNLYKVVIRLVGANNSFIITGIAGGTDGRHIVLLNINSSSMTLVNQSIGSSATNRINTLGTPNESTSGRGAIELIYDGALSRWLILSVRN